MRVLLLLLLTSMASAEAPPQGLVKGSVTADHQPLPGSTVTLEGGTVRRTTVSNAAGEYQFDTLSAGEYELTFGLAGFLSEERKVIAGDGTAVVPAVELTAAETITLTFDCSSPCGQDEPVDSFDRPSCAEYELSSTLIDALKENDRSALALLKHRYATTASHAERHRLGVALLGRGRDDRAVWEELVAHAELALRSPHVDHELSPEYVQWCNEHGVDPQQSWWLSVDALTSAGHDPRSRPLLIRALATEDDDLIIAAIIGFALQHDQKALAEIEKAIERLPEEGRHVAFFLINYDTAEADALALRLLLDEDDRERFREEVTTRTAMKAEGSWQAAGER